MLAFVISAALGCPENMSDYKIDSVWYDHRQSIDEYNKLVDEALACGEEIVAEVSNKDNILHSTQFTLGLIRLEKHEIRGSLLQFAEIK